MNSFRKTSISLIIAYKNLAQWIGNALPIFSSTQQSGASGGSIGSGAGVSGTCKNSILQNYKTNALNNYLLEINHSSALNYRMTGGRYPNDAI